MSDGIVNFMISIFCLYSRKIWLLSIYSIDMLLNNNNNNNNILTIYSPSFLFLFFVMMVKPGQQYPLPNTVNITRQGVRVYKWRTRIIRGVGNFLEPLWSNTAEYKHLLKENTIKTGTKSRITRKDVMLQCHHRRKPKLTRTTYYRNWTLVTELEGTEKDGKKYENPTVTLSNCSNKSVHALHDILSYFNLLLFSSRDLTSWSRDLTSWSHDPSSFCCILLHSR